MTFSLKAVLDEKKSFWNEKEKLFSSGSQNVLRESEKRIQKFGVPLVDGVAVASHVGRDVAVFHQQLGRLRLGVGGEGGHEEGVAQHPVGDVVDQLV